jgi:ADP-ribosylglycohydrolase
MGGKNEVVEYHHNDVDTLAAMTGGLAGARLGIEAVPRYLIDCLEDEEQGKRYLFELASKLHGIDGIGTS